MALGLMIVWVLAMGIGIGLGRESMKYEKDCEILILEAKLKKKTV